MTALLKTPSLFLDKTECHRSRRLHSTHSGSQLRRLHTQRLQVKASKNSTDQLSSESPASGHSQQPNQNVRANRTTLRHSQSPLPQTPLQRPLPLPKSHLQRKHHQRLRVLRRHEHQRQLLPLARPSRKRPMGLDREPTRPRKHRPLLDAPQRHPQVSLFARHLRVVCPFFGGLARGEGY